MKKIYHAFLQRESRFKSISAIALIGLAFIALLTACGAVVPDSPENLRIENDVLLWDEVFGATSYHVEVDDQMYTVQEAKFDLMDLRTVDRTYRISVSASTLNSRNSEWSEAIEYRLQPTEGYFLYGAKEGEQTCRLVGRDPNDGPIAGRIVIPSEINGFPVTEIGSEAFQNCTEITEVILPDTITEIQSYAFAGSGIKRFYFPSSPKIACWVSVFKDCANLEKVYLSEGVNRLGTGTFTGCENLREVIVDKKNEKFVFENNCLLSKDGQYLYDTIKGFRIPDSVKTINQGSINLYEGETVSIPSSVTMINHGAFVGKTAKALIVDPESTCYRSEGNCIVDIRTGEPELGIPYNTKTNAVVAGLPDSVIPNWATRIAPYAFEGRSGMKTLKIPDSVKRIDEEAFRGCSDIETVTFGEGVTRIGDRAFYQCLSLRRVSFPDALEYIGSYCFLGTAIKTVILPDSLYHVGHSAFSGVNGFVTFDIPSVLEREWKGIIGMANDFFDCNGILFHCCTFASDGEDGMPYVYSWLSSSDYTYPSGQIVPFDNCDLRKGFRDDFDLPVLLERKGYTFLGWTTQEGGTVEYAPDDVKVWGSVPSDTVLYTVWEKNN